MATQTAIAVSGHNLVLGVFERLDDLLMMLETFPPASFIRANRGLLE